MVDTLCCHGDKKPRGMSSAVQPRVADKIRWMYGDAQLTVGVTGCRLPIWGGGVDGSGGGANAPATPGSSGVGGDGGHPDSNADGPGGGGPPLLTS